MNEFLSIGELKKQTAEDFKRVQNQAIYYKYASYSVVEKNILPDKTLRFTSPEFFNDPFDCNEQLLDIHIDEKNIKGLVEEKFEKLPRNVRGQFIKFIQDPRTIQRVLQKEKNNFKISCFSTKCDDILMWSHYASKHTGVCLGFEFPCHGGLFNMYPVRYIDKIRKLHGTTLTEAVFNYWLTRKPICWAYENEIRAITRSGQDNIGFEQHQLKEIIFGCKVKKTEIDSIIQRANQLGYIDATFKKMEINPATFLLKIIPA